MPKQKAGFINAAYEEVTVDWGYLMAEAIREQINNVKKSKSQQTILARCVTTLHIALLENVVLT